MVGWCLPQSHVNPVFTAQPTQHSEHTKISQIRLGSGRRALQAAAVKIGFPLQILNRQAGSSREPAAFKIASAIKGRGEAGLRALAREHEPVTVCMLTAAAEAGSGCAQLVYQIKIAWQFAWPPMFSCSKSSASMNSDVKEIVYSTVRSQMYIHEHRRVR